MGGHHVFWTRPDSQCTTVTTGSGHNHGFRNAPTEMSVGLTETVQVAHRVLGGRVAFGKSRAGQKTSCNRQGANIGILISGRMTAFSNI